MTTQELAKKMYETINNVVMPQDTSVTPTSIFTMYSTGLTVNSEDYDPNTDDGIRNRNLLADAIPQVQGDFIDSGKKVSGVYKNILQMSKFPADKTRTKEEEEILKNAEEFLAENVDVYLEGMDAYYDARDNYWGAVNEKASSREISSLKRKMDAELMKWKSTGQKLEFEEKLAIQRELRAVTPNKVFREASDNFEHMGDSYNGYEVLYLPSQWQDPKCPIAWSDISVSETSQSVKVHNDISSISEKMSGRFSVGLWGASGDSKYKKDVERMNTLSQAAKVTLTMKIARVQIQRRWLDLSLMGFNTSHIPGLSAFDISNGKIQGGVNRQMPVLPTSLVLAKDITMYSNFSEEEEKLMKEIIKEEKESSVNLLWFKLGNNSSEFNNKLTEQEKKKYNANFSLKIGMGKSVILGYLNTVVPAYSHQDGTKLHANNQLNMRLGNIYLGELK